MSLRVACFLAFTAVAMAGCQRQEPDAVAPATAAAPAEAKDSAPNAALSEDTFRKGMALEGVGQVRYVGERGEKLSFAEFIQIVQGGRSFRKEVEGDKSLAVMTINPKDEEQKPGLAGRTASAQPLSVPVSSMLPALPGKDLGNHLNVLANGKHYTLMSFFFAECVPCIQEVPALNALADGRADLKVVSVTFETRQVAADFARKRGLKTSIVPDAQAYIDALGVKVYPTLILVSPEGRLMGVRSSYQSTGVKDAGLAELKAWMASLGLKTA